MLPCDICGKAGHSWFACPDRSKKPEGWKPDRLRKPAGENPHLVGSPYVPQIEALEASKAVVGGGRKVGKVAAIAKIAKDLRTKGVKVVDLNAPVIDLAPNKTAKRGRGRPASIEDMKTYKAEKQREYRKRRAAQKEAKP